MTGARELVTPRLRLRQWRHSDRHPFAAMNADPEVMRHFPALQDAAQSDAAADRFSAHLDSAGWGLWALEFEGEFIGFTGLAVPRFDAPFTPCVEVGWRLARSAWGMGLATEAATAAMGFGFTELGLAEIVSFTTVANDRSRALMQRLGMTRDPADDFEHPAIPSGSPQRLHVLYRLANPATKRLLSP
jgi:RimJ/RimL family protein N-acetyltransferase